VEGRPEPLGIFDHERVCWLGDLNYRLNFRESDMDQMYNLIEAKDYASLLIADQLLLEKASGALLVLLFVVGVYAWMILSTFSRKHIRRILRRQDRLCSNLQIHSTNECL